MANNQEWVSVYIYHNISFEKVIIELIKPLVFELETNNKITNSFFIRYFDDGPHIRLRLYTNKNDFIKNYISKYIADFFSSNNTPNTDYSIKFNNYIQEIQRYGGDNCIKISENHFEASSKCILDSISDNYTNWDYSLAISHAIQMHLIFAKEAMNTLDESIYFFNSVFNNWLAHAIKPNDNEKITHAEIEKTITFFKNSYNSQKETINYLTKTIWTENLENHWALDWSKKCNELQAEMILLFQQDKISIPKWFAYNEKSPINKQNQITWSIYDSYVHMTNNRLGINLRDESFIAFLILNGLKSIN